MNIRRIARSLSTSIIVAALTITLIPAKSFADEVNLFANSGLENSAVSGGVSPDYWMTDSWGSNTSSFSYENTGHNGTHSVKTTVQNYQDGDAKWIPTGSLVAPGTSYHYTDWYKSTTATNVWAQYRTTAGTYQYAFLKQLPANQSVWTELNVDTVIPSGVSALSIFHVISSNGELAIDDVSLTQNATCDGASINGLYNGGFETSCDGTSPSNWQQVQYGSSNAIFSLSPSAHQGSRALLVTNQDEGAEVGLQTSIATPLAGQLYNLSFWQSGDTYVYAYLAYGMNDGSTQYTSLMSAPATGGEWSKYSDSFVTPAGVKNITITIATSGVGSIAFDDVAFTSLANSTPADFQKAIVSLTFDDGALSTYTGGFTPLKQYGYKGTFYLNAGSLDTANYMTTNQALALYANGQEIGSHLYHHSDIVQMDDATLNSELAGNKSSLQNIFGVQTPINAVATPYGSYTSPKVDTILQYATSHRTTDGELNTKANFDVRQIHARLITPSTTAAVLKSWIAEAVSEHAWLVLVYHNISTSTANLTDEEANYNVTPAVFKKHLAAIKQSGLSVQTVAQAIATLQAQY